MALDSSDKAFNKAYSAVLKQALQKTFLLSSADAVEEDPDAESPERHTPQNPRWDCFELEADIGALLQQTELDAEMVERFRSYLLEVYGVKSWSEMPLPRLAQVRDRLRELPVEERRETIILAGRRRRRRGLIEAAPPTHNQEHERLKQSGPRQRSARLKSSSSSRWPSAPSLTLNALAVELTRQQEQKQRLCRIDPRDARGLHRHPH